MSFWEQLQSLDESTKTKILVVVTMVVMTVVVYFWLAYFNAIIVSAGPSGGGAAVAQTAPQAAVTAPAAALAVGNAAPAASDSAGIGRGAVIALGYAYGQFVNMIHAIGNIFQAPREYIVRPE